MDDQKKRAKGAAFPERTPKPYVKQAAVDVGQSRPPESLRGTVFFESVETLRDNPIGGGAASAKVTVPVSYGDRRIEFQRTATFSVSEHTGTGTVQGMMSPSSKTKYTKVLPTRLTQDRATVEARMLKALSPGGEDYNTRKNAVPMDDAAKADEHLLSEKRKTFLAPGASPLGGIALGSFLEDITAGRGLSLQNVGSAMRAILMTEKWKLKLGEQGAGEGFADKMFGALPQLGNEKKPIKTTVGDVQLPKTGLAELKKHWANPNTFTVESQIESIHQVHQEAHRTASRVFDYKLEDPARRQAARWWKAQDLNESKEMLRTKYLDWKMTRHGIRRMPDAAAPVAMEQVVGSRGTKRPLKKME